MVLYFLSFARDDEWKQNWASEQRLCQRGNESENKEQDEAG